MNIYYSHWRAFHIYCPETYVILCCLNRQDELQRLIAWADSKGFAGPRRAYEFKLSDVEHTLFRYQAAAPQSARIANILHSLKLLICPLPLYHARGSAAAYRTYNA